MSVLGKFLSEQFCRHIGHDEDRFTDKVSSEAALFLYVGCGPDRGANIRHGFNDGWQEVRFDIDPAVQPDIVGSVLDMSAIPDASVDVVYTSHTLEHLYNYEIPVALGEMLRVLKPGGIALAIVPDLQSTAQLVAEDRLFETLFVSPDGPITPFDVLYGHRGFVGQGNTHMAHRGGFTLSSLSGAMTSAGFKSVAGIRRPAAFDLGVIASPEELPEARLRALVTNHLPT